MHNLTNGEYIQAKKNRNFNDKQELTKSYMLKTYMKTASLMAIGMRGVAIINNQDYDMEQKYFEIGQHIGIAFQLIDDVLDYTSTSQEMGKQQYGDLKEGHITGPLIFSDLNPQTIEILKKYKSLNEEQIQTILKQTNLKIGIEKTKRLAILHAKYSIKLAGDDQLIKELIYKIISRNH